MDLPGLRGPVVVLGVLEVLVVGLHFGGPVEVPVGVLPSQVAVVGLAAEVGGGGLLAPPARRPGSEEARVRI